MTGKQLRALRRKARLTQLGLAKLLGVSSNTIARQERGELRIREPQALLAERIATSFEELNQAKREFEAATKVVYGRRAYRLGPAVSHDPIPPRPSIKRRSRRG